MQGEMSFMRLIPKQMKGVCNASGSRSTLSGKSRLDEFYPGAADAIVHHEDNTWTPLIGYVPFLTLSTIASVIPTVGRQSQALGKSGYCECWPLHAHRQVSLETKCLGRGLRQSLQSH